MDPHRLAEERSLALHEAVARAIRGDFLRAAVDAGLVQVELLLARLATVTVEEPRREAARARIEATRRGQASGSLRYFLWRRRLWMRTSMR